MSIANWPADERPREKLLSKGVTALSDAELLAIFLRTGARGQSAVDIARALLNHYDGLPQLLAASPGNLCQQKGIGPAKYVQLQAALELGRRQLASALKRGDSLTSPQTTARYLQAELGHLPHEVFACLFLDNRNRVITFEPLFSGTIDSASVYPREIVRRVLHHNAASVIFAHNHPSGVCEPSEADRSITRRLTDALRLIDVRVLDHLVVGADNYTSMAARGDI